MVNRERIIKNFKTLSSINGTHGNEIHIANELISQLTQIGLEVKMDDAGKTFGGNSGNLIARLPGNVEAMPMFLCAHMDTILPTANLKHDITNGIIKSDRTTILGADNRAGITIIIEILNVLKEESIPHGTIEVLFTVCEEAGMYGAKNISRSNLESMFGFIFDSQASPGSYIIEAPSAVRFNLIVNGREAHAAVSPEKGVHAIQIASKAVAQLKMGRWADTGMLNIGTIQGGTAINVIPKSAEITGEIRHADAAELNLQKQHIIDSFNIAAKESGGSVVIEFLEKYGGYKFSGIEPMIKIAEKAISDAGLSPNAVKYPGGSDANIFNNNGIPALNLGVGMKNAHSFEEMISIDDLMKTTEIGINLIRNTPKHSMVLE